jgi:hypothetical protein
MQYNCEIAIEGNRRFVAFTSELGKEILDLGAVNQGSMVSFLPHVDPDYAFEWDDPTSSLPRDFMFTATALGPSSGRSYLVMLLDEKLYLQRSEAAKLRQARIIRASIRFMTSIVGKENLFIVFPRDMDLPNILAPLAEVSVNIFLLPYTVRELRMDYSKRLYSSSIVQQFATYRYLRLLKQSDRLSVNLEHYKMSNVFDHLSFVHSGLHDQVSLCRLMSCQPDAAVSSIVQQIGRLTFQEKMSLTQDQKAEVTQLISRFAAIEVGSTTHITSDPVAFLLNVQHGAAGVPQQEVHPAGNGDQLGRRPCPENKKPKKKRTTRKKRVVPASSSTFDSMLPIASKDFVCGAKPTSWKPFPSGPLSGSTVFWTSFDHPRVDEHLRQAEPKGY